MRCEECSAHLPRCGPVRRRPANETHNCRSDSGAGTALDAPHLPFAMPAGIDSIGWKAAARPAVSDMPLLSHNPCPGRDRGAGHETPRFYNFTRRRNGWMAIRRACAAEGDAGDRLPGERGGRRVCAACRRVPPGAERNRLGRGTESGDSNTAGPSTLTIGCPHWPRISSAARSI
jgi:hypothetical protein